MNLEGTIAVNRPSTVLITSAQ